MENLVAGELSVAIDETAPEAIRLSWRGRSVDRHPDRALGGFLTAAVAAARERGALLEHHLEELDYFNSSTVGALVHHIHAARAAGVKLALRYDGARTWQRVSFEALRSLMRGDGLLELRPV